jgi:glutathione peroxidase-family protein
MNEKACFPYKPNKITDYMTKFMIDKNGRVIGRFNGAFNP